MHCMRAAGPAGAGAGRSCGCSINLETAAASDHLDHHGTPQPRASTVMPRRPFVRVAYLLCNACAGGGVGQPAPAPAAPPPAPKGSPPPAPAVNTPQPSQPITSGSPSIPAGGPATPEPPPPPPPPPQLPEATQVPPFFPKGETTSPGGGPLCSLSRWPALCACAVIVDVHWRRCPRRRGPGHCTDN